MSVTDTLMRRNAERSGHSLEKRSLCPPACTLWSSPVPTTGSTQRMSWVLDLGEAVVLRNAGGRVTPAVLENLALLAVISISRAWSRASSSIVVHHTDCGLSRLGGPEQAGLLARYFRVPEGGIPGKHVTDPSASVRADLEVLRANPLVPRTLIVSGVVYDIQSGRTEVICPPAPLGPSQ